MTTNDILLGVGLAAQDLLPPGGERGILGSRDL
jgi:hypothetical protein